jgi:murein L,D-transpeptidase YafK
VLSRRCCRFFPVFLLLIVALAGCAGGLERPKDTGATLEPGYIYVSPTTPLTAEQKYIQGLLSKNGYNGKGSKPTVIVVHKLTRKLTFYQGTTPLKTYPVVLGNDPYNEKLCQGDTCTPEGVYKVRAKYPHPRWSRFIWLDYPNTQNWLKFSRAKQSGRIPVDADIGGQIGIHGTEETWRNRCGENWTKGCVSLTNQDLEEIYPLVNEKTLVVILKH